MCVFCPECFMYDTIKIRETFDFLKIVSSLVYVLLLLLAFSSETHAVVQLIYNLRSSFRFRKSHCFLLLVSLEDAAFKMIYVQSCCINLFLTYFKLESNVSQLCKLGIVLLLVLKNTVYVEPTIHTNEFALHISGDNELANRVADKYGFFNRGQIGSLKGYYLFVHHEIHKRASSPSITHCKLLQNDSSVLWFEQQEIKRRVKRSIFKSSISEFRDPLYPEQWFLHGGGSGGYDMNVIVAWDLGFSGKGVVVSILDDGIQSNHPDLAQNYDKDASWDINDSDDDPTPQDDDDNKHGTRCAGEVAAVAHNEFCGVGIAYNSSIGGVRMLDGSVTDSIEASALSLNPDHIHIYSASWGPEDDGKTVDGPGPLAKIAFKDGINKLVL